MALHAGELALGMVPPEQLGNHISDSVMIGGADRIGHGVDLYWENAALPLLKVSNTETGSGTGHQGCVSRENLGPLW